MRISYCGNLAAIRPTKLSFHAPIDSVNESPSIRIRGRGSVSGTCLTFSSRKPWLFTLSEYLSRPQARVVEQYGCNASTRQGSRPRHPKSSAGVGTDER
ncbi:MAG: hypothetical protein ABSE85_20985, partial [Candidatus Korobacteraceae bacterium]